MPGSESDLALRLALRMQDISLYHVKTKLQSWSFNSYGALINMKPSWKLSAGRGEQRQTHLCACFHKEALVG